MKNYLISFSVCVTVLLVTRQTFTYFGADADTVGHFGGAFSMIAFFWAEDYYKTKQREV